MIKRIFNKLRCICFYYTQKQWYGQLYKTDFVNKPLIISGKKNIFLGKNVFFRDGARIECISSWKEQKFSPKLEIGDNTTFEQDLHLICANHVKIGSDCVFSARVFISDLSHEYKDINKSVMQQPLVVKDIEIGDGCFVGYGVCILPGVHLGKHCIVGANAVVTKSYPDFCVLTGNPSVCIKRYDVESKTWKKTDKYGNFIQ
ncbi:MAG: acyltransferase [Treponema sp.]|nr:acyltransferase [Treponema sp.]